MKLIDLHPEFRRVNDDPDLYEISFDCPRCKTPWRVSFKACFNKPPQPPATWSLHADPFGFPPLPPFNWNSVTVVPSYSATSGTAHGRKQKCFVHFSITNGEVILAQ